MARPILRSPASRASARREAPHALAALARANLLFWPTVAPVVRRELKRWEDDAARIGDRALRELAQVKLRDERFNAEVAATLATLVPRPRRALATRAIVALELLFDYLDGRSEQVAAAPSAVGEQLFAPLIAASEATPAARPRRPGADDAPGEPSDADYVWALSREVSSALCSLPAARQVEDVARRAAVRCAQAQTRLHAAISLGDAQLERWAREKGAASGLEWREFAGGSASSVLCMHALIAAAADPATGESDVRRLDAAYLAIGGVITTLDSLVDEAADRARREPGFTRLFDSEDELARRLVELTRDAHARAREAPHGAHHVMTLAGAIAYYSTHPGAREDPAHAITLRLRRELSPTIWPTLAVMTGWRTAKRVRSLNRPAGARAPGSGDPPEP